MVTFQGPSVIPLTGIVPAVAVYDPADANANHVKFVGPVGGTVHVPVFAFGDNSIYGVDQGFFNGITHPEVTVFDDPGTSYVGFGHSANAVGSIYTLATGGSRTESVSFTETQTKFGGVTSVVPLSDDLAALGTTALQWSDLYLASGAVIGFNVGADTITHTANTLTVAGITTLALAAATSITTAGTTLTLNPATDVHITNGKGIVIGHTAQLSLGNGGGGPVALEVEVLGTGQEDSSIGLLRASADGSSAAISFNKSRNAAIGSFTIVTNGDRLGEIIFSGDDGADYGATAAKLYGESDGTPGTNDMPGRLVFSTTADGGQTVTERLRITSAGTITTLSASASNVTAAQAAIFGGGIAFTDVANAWIDDATQGTGTTTIYIGNQTITTSSDLRLKRDIADSQMDALDTLGRLRVVDYAWGDNYGAHVAYNRRGRWTGMIAQEVIDVVPYIINDGGGRDCRVCREGRVTCKEHGDWFVQYDHLVPVLVKAIQELNTKVEALS